MSFFFFIIENILSYVVLLKSPKVCTPMYKGKCALITDVIRGTGAAVARELLRKKATVYNIINIIRSAL